jgi:hypothetical protein
MLVLLAIKLFLLLLLLLLDNGQQRQTPHWLAEVVTLVVVTLDQVHHQPAVLLFHVVDHRVGSVGTRAVIRRCRKLADSLIGRCCRHEETTASSGLADGLFARRCTVVGPTRSHDGKCFPFFDPGVAKRDNIIGRWRCGKARTTKIVGHVTRWTGRSRFVFFLLSTAR